MITTNSLRTLSRQNLFHDSAMFHAGELLVESLVLEREPLVVETEQVQHGRVEVADRDRGFDDVVREVIGLAVNRATFGSASGHPPREAARMMIATVILSRDASL